LKADGGGTRGLSQLYILREILSRLIKPREASDLRPCEFFDLIGGSGPSGLLALVLARFVSALTWVTSDADGLDSASQSRRPSILCTRYLSDLMMLRSFASKY
jgi:hypothetical protein